MDPQPSPPLSISDTLTIKPSRIFNHKTVRLRFDPKRGNYDFEFSNNVYHFRCKKDANLDTQSWIITDADDRITYWLSTDVTPVLREVIKKHFSGDEKKVDFLVVENLPFRLDFLENDVNVQYFHFKHSKSPSSAPKLTSSAPIASDDATHYLTSEVLVDATWKVVGNWKQSEIMAEFYKFFETFDELTAEHLATVIRMVQKEPPNQGMTWRFSGASLLSVFDLDNVLCNVANEFRHCATWKYVETMKSRGKKKALNIQLSQELELNVLIDLPMRMDDLPRVVLQVQKKGKASPHPSLLPDHHHIVAWLRPHFHKFIENLEWNNPNAPPKKTKNILNCTLSYLDWILFQVLFIPISTLLMMWMWTLEEFGDGMRFAVFLFSYAMVWFFASSVWLVKLKDRNTNL